MKVIIAGSRDFDNKKLLFAILDKELLTILHNPLYHIQKEMVIVSGNARGADRLGEEWAKSRNVKLEIMTADWNGPHGKAAGFIRNHAMVDVSTHAFFFWNGFSRGTKDCLEYALKKGLWVKVVHYLQVVNES